MIEGLGFLPRIQAERQRLLDNDVPVSHAQYLNCAACELTEGERALWLCGWMPEEKRIDSPGRPFPESTICPGYSITLPEVIEASRLLLWTRRGQLEAVVESMPIPPAAALCIDILDSACNETERETWKRQRQEAEAKRGAH